MSNYRQSPSGTSALDAAGVARQEVASSLDDSNATLQVGDGTVHRMLVGVQTAVRTLTLGTTNAVLGSVKRVENHGTTHNLNITNGGALGDSLQAVLPGFAREFIYDGVDWQEGGRYPLPS